MCVYVHTPDIKKTNVLFLCRYKVLPNHMLEACRVYSSICTVTVFALG